MTPSSVIRPCSVSSCPRDLTVGTGFSLNVPRRANICGAAVLFSGAQAKVPTTVFGPSANLAKWSLRVTHHVDCQACREGVPGFKYVRSLLRCVERASCAPTVRRVNRSAGEGKPESVAFQTSFRAGGEHPENEVLFRTREEGESPCCRSTYTTSLFFATARPMFQTSS